MFNPFKWHIAKVDKYFVARRLSILYFPWGYLDIEEPTKYIWSLKKSTLGYIARTSKDEVIEAVFKAKTTTKSKSKFYETV